MVSELRRSCCAVGLLVAAACGSSSSGPLELRAVVAENVKRLEGAIGTEPKLEKPDTELVDRTRALVNTVAAQKGAFRESFAGQAQELGDAIVPLLSGWIATHDPGYAVRRASIELLAALDTPRAEHALVYHASENPEVWVRSNCAWWLGETKQDQCMVALLEAAIEERDVGVKASIDHTLTTFGCFAPISGEGAYDPEVLRRWRWGDPEGKLPVHVPSPRLELEVWRRIEALGGADAGARSRAVSVLGNLPAFAAGLLSTALRDTSAEVRRGAARALAGMELRGASAGPTLHESLLRDPEVTVEAIEALGAVHHEASAEDVAEYVGASHPLEQRVAAARALGRLEVARTLPALQSALKPGEPEALRTTAAIALVSFGRESEAFPVLADALAGSSPEAEAIVSRVLEWLQARAGRGDERAQKWLQQWTDLGATRESRAKVLREEIVASVR